MSFFCLYSTVNQTNTSFCAETPAWGFRTNFPLSEFRENGRLIIEVYIDVVEAIDGEGTDVSQKKEAVDINGFQAFASHVSLKGYFCFKDQKYVSVDFIIGHFLFGRLLQ